MKAEMVNMWKALQWVLVLVVWQACMTVSRGEPAEALQADTYYNGFLTSLPNIFGSIGRKLIASAINVPIDQEGHYQFTFLPRDMRDSDNGLNMINKDFQKIKSLLKEFIKPEIYMTKDTTATQALAQKITTAGLPDIIDRLQKVATGTGTLEGENYLQLFDNLVNQQELTDVVKTKAMASMKRGVMLRLYHFITMARVMICYGQNFTEDAQAAKACIADLQLRTVNSPMVVNIRAYCDAFSVFFDGWKHEPEGGYASWDNFMQMPGKEGSFRVPYNTKVMGVHCDVDHEFGFVASTNKASLTNANQLWHCNIYQPPNMTYADAVAASSVDQAKWHLTEHVPEYDDDNYGLGVPDTYHSTASWVWATELGHPEKWNWCQREFKCSGHGQCIGEESAGCQCQCWGENTWTGDNCEIGPGSDDYYILVDAYNEGFDYEHHGEPAVHFDLKLTAYGVWGQTKEYQFEQWSHKWEDHSEPNLFGYIAYDLQSVGPISKIRIRSNGSMWSYEDWILWSVEVDVSHYMWDAWFQCDTELAVWGEGAVRERADYCRLDYASGPMDIYLFPDL